MTNESAAEYHRRKQQAAKKPKSDDYDRTTGTLKSRAQLEAEGKLPPADH